MDLDIGFIDIPRFPRLTTSLCLQLVCNQGSKPHFPVSEAIAMAIDHQALIQLARHGFASPLCTDHPSAYHPGNEPSLPCATFDSAAANKLLHDNGWVKSADGVRVRGKQQLEFE
jgi:ABC-type transport system substrate-binding protein